MIYENEWGKVNILEPELIDRLRKGGNRILVHLSAGTNSALMLYLILRTADKQGIDLNVFCVTQRDIPTAPAYAQKIIDLMRKKFPNARIHNTKVFEDPDPNRDPLDLMDGNVKQSKYMRDLLSQYMVDNGIQVRAVGLTQGPDFMGEELFKREDESQPGKNIEDSRPRIGGVDEDVILTARRFGFIGTTLYRPFINIDKRFVATAYHRFNLMDDLYPLTRSCVGSAYDTYNFTKPCKVCPWCLEKHWAFGRYDATE